MMITQAVRGRDQILPMSSFFETDRITSSITQMKLEMPSQNVRVVGSMYTLMGYASQRKNDVLHDGPAAFDRPVDLVFRAYSPGRCSGSK